VGKSKVVLDTNILISALGWNGKPHKILAQIISGDVELFISQAQFDELSRVLDYPKFEFEEEQKSRFKALVSAVATFVDAPARLDVVKEDPADSLILESAVAARADFIVSGDEHLLSLGKVNGTRILTANDFLKLG
jgi:putative PIN family toxin of toxin-antitoxin system